MTNQEKQQKAAAIRAEITDMKIQNELILALICAEKELRLLNVDQDGGQLKNTPAAAVIAIVRATLAKVGA